MSYGQFDAGTNESEFNAISFLIKQAMLKMQTVTLVKVVGVHGVGVAPTGTVDVQPMVNQMTGDRTAVAHGTIYGVPFFRLQGGPSAFICDPVVGDIGLCGFASRDISSVKSTKAVANPGSQRVFDYADGLYVGGFINGVPTQYIEMLGGAGGITITTPADVTINAAAFTANAPTTLESLTVNGTTILTGPTTASAITSTGVITAAGFSGPGGSSPAGPPGPAGPTGPTGPIGPAFLSVSDGTTTTPNITEIIFNGATVTISGSTATVTGTGGGGGVSSVTGNATYFTTTNPSGPNVTFTFSTGFLAALAATATLAADALQPKTGLTGSYTNVNLTIDSNGQITAVSNGSGGGGGPQPFGVFTLPNLSAWTTTVDGSTTMAVSTSADGAVNVVCTQVSAANGYFWVAGIPSTFDAIFCFTCTGSGTNGLAYIAPYVRDPATGNVVDLGSSGSSPLQNIIDILNLNSVAGTNPSSFGFVSTAGSGSIPFSLGLNPLWIRFTATGGGNYSIRASADGVYWGNVAAGNWSYAANPTQFGFAFFNTSGNLRILSYNGAVG